MEPSFRVGLLAGVHAKREQFAAKLAWISGRTGTQGDALHGIAWFGFEVLDPRSSLWVTGFGMLEGSSRPILTLRLKISLPIAYALS